MGQKTNPISFRLVRNRNWRSKWFANKQEFGTLLLEDRKIRSCLTQKPICAGTSQIRIRRMSGKIGSHDCDCSPRTRHWQKRG